jgi:hypothetical protein
MTVPTFTSRKSDDPLATELPTLELGQPDRLLNPKERLAAWDTVFGAGELAPHQMRGYRTVLGWRMTRAIAFKQGRLHLDQRLAHAIDDDEWMTPVKTGAPTRLLSHRVEDWHTRDLLARNEGVSLTPSTNTAAQHACLVTRLADSMWLQRGSKQFPRLGYYGLHGLTHPNTLVEFWPTRAEVLAFEDKLVDQIQGLVLKWSRRKIQSHLRDMFDLTIKEIGGLIALATQEAKDEAYQDIETTRAVMVGKVEDYIDRMRECADSSNEMKGIKVLCAIHGLHKTDPENTAEMLIGVIAKVASDNSATTSPLRIEVSDKDDDEVIEEKQES